MGKKSEKKVKSDRVNALRKQYDAFLEEDKKRKERNEYILGRLDNMRYNSTAVQIRHKPIVYGDVMPVINRGAYRPEQFERRDLSTHPDHRINQNLQLDVPNNYLGNTSLLNEISKKYILIPKLRSLSANDYVGVIAPQSLPPISVSSPQSNIANKEDWKSKYDILDQLKKNEREEQTGKYANDELYPVKEKQTLSKYDTNIIDTNHGTNEFKTPKRGDGFAMQSYDTKEFATKYEQEIAEKDLTFDRVAVESEPQHERSKISDNKDQEPDTNAPNSSASANSNPKTFGVYDGYKLQNHSLENQAPVESIMGNNNEQNVYDSNYPNENVIESSEFTNEEITNNSEHQVNDVPHQQEYPIEYEQPIEIEGKYPDPENVYLDPDDYSPIQVIHPTAVVTQIPNEHPVTDTTDIKEEEVVEYPLEMLNVKEFTPKDDVKLIDGENVNPKYFASETVEPAQENNPVTETVDEHTVDPTDNSGIEAFDAEQREMFYSEDTTEYAYDQQQSNVYNQEQAEAPAQDYAYYESPDAALQEQQYPAEINEHEESNTLYDQNFEQQYTTEYEQQQYEQPAGYDQTEQQQYVQPEGYDQTEQLQYTQPEDYEQSEQQYAVYEQTEQQYQGYEYQQPDLETVQNVQQDLDNEAGYVDQQNSEAVKVEAQPEPTPLAVDQKTA